jgi:tellurite resistance protein
MIIFGTKAVTRTIAQGQFTCPYCHQSPFRHRQVRRFFHLYFIPLIPLATDGEYVECGMCSGTYDVRILDVATAQDAEQFEARFAVAVRRVMALITAADGVVDPAEIAMMASLYDGLVGKPISEAELREEVDFVRTEGLEVRDYLEEVAGELNGQGKEAVVRAAIGVAMADGEFDDAEHDLVVDVGRALGLTKAHFRGIFEQVLDELEQAQTQPPEPAANASW